MFFYIVFTLISTTSGLVRKYHQIDEYIYQCVGAPFMFSNHLAEEEIACCFTCIVLCLSVFFVSSSWCCG